MKQLSLNVLVGAAVVCLAAGHGHAAVPPPSPILSPLEQALSQIVSEDDRQRPPESEVTRLLSDNSRARQVLGWEPRVSLREGLKRVIDWWRDRRPRFGWNQDAI